MPLFAGDRFRLPLANGRKADLHVVSLEPESSGLLGDDVYLALAWGTTDRIGADIARFFRLGTVAALGHDTDAFTLLISPWPA